MIQYCMKILILTTVEVSDEAWIILTAVQSAMPNRLQLVQSIKGAMEKMYL